VNKPIRTMAIVTLLLFVALLVNVTVLQYVRADELNADDRNRRVIVASFSRERGAILAGREPIAESVPVDDQYDYQRTYPEPLRYAHVTGYFSYYSQTALERTQNEILSGEDSRLFVTRLVDLLTSADPSGGNVQTTLNRRAQVAAFEGLQGLGRDTQGAVVALEPDTGKILAMVSTPSYDPNRLADHDLSAVLDGYEALVEREDEPLINRGAQTTLPPGSTFKIVTAAAALESGNYDSDALVPGGPTYQLPLTEGPSGLIDNGGRDCGTDRIPLVQALANSCNTTFLALADQIGLEDLQAQAEAFGFNSEYLDALPMAESRFPGDLDEPQTALAGIGQSDVAATPLQMAMVVAGVANDGVVMKPYVVDEVRSPDLDVLERAEPTELSRAVSPSTAEELTEMLVTTVADGTATPAQIPGIDVAGKTGTAQSTPERPPYAWFVSFAPASDPQVAVAVLVESTDVARDEIAGGALGGPIAKSVMEAVINP
jgi:peptidoglycan glycosyltransferase